MTTREALYRQMCDAVVAFEEENVAELARRSLDEGYDPLQTILEGLSAGMVVVGELFEKHAYFVPEVLLCADAMQAGLDVLQPHISGEKSGTNGRVVLGTVQGDVHDIGKNIVKLMLDVGGFSVHDLGKDVAPEKFVEEMERIGADIVAMSAMMTTTMMGMKKTVEMIRARSPHVAVMVGGAPLNAEIAKLFGADGYADTAVGAVEEAARMMELVKGRRDEVRGG